tara:strand:- start:211 stop:501 length:291 start_codon:yes stop_codon:yes gene_type:complete
MAEKTQNILNTTPNNGLAYLQLQLATINVQLQTIILKLKDKNENIAILATLLNNLKNKGQEIKKQLGRDSNKCKNLIDSYESGIKSAKTILRQVAN